MTPFKAGDKVEVEDFYGNKVPGEIVSGPHGSVWSGAHWYEVTVDGRVLQYFAENISYPIDFSKGLVKSKDWAFTAPMSDNYEVKARVYGTFHDGHSVSASTTKKPSDVAPSNYTDWYAEEEAKKKQKYIDEGRCEQCGIKMEIDHHSWHLVCPIHGAKLNKHGF